MAAMAMGRGPKEATETSDRDLRDDPREDDLAQDLLGFARQVRRELQQKRPQSLGLPASFLAISLGQKFCIARVLLESLVSVSQFLIK